MKKLVLLLCLTTALFACNSESNTDTNTSDSSAVEQDNTINRDTGMMNSPDTGMMNADTMGRRDSAR